MTNHDFLTFDFALTASRSSAKASTTIKKAKGSSAQLPELRKWPKIDVSNITQVTREMVQRISENDELGIFSKPVIEAHPTIADAYLNVIETPIDLRTIEEERVNIYNSIQGLQDDLVLMFRNCCTFNANTDFWEIAKTQWEDINQVFFDVCEELGVLLPRHWKP